MNVEGYDIKEKMLKERRDWILEQKQLYNKIPNDLEKFHARYQEDAALSPEEELARMAAADEEVKAKKDKKKARRTKRREPRRRKSE